MVVLLLHGKLMVCKYSYRTFFFFFLIGKKKYIQKTARCKKHQHIRSTKKKKQKTKTKNINYKERELRKRGRESLDVSPQALAQSNKELEKRASIWSSDLSKSSSFKVIKMSLNFTFKSHFSFKIFKINPNLCDKDQFPIYSLSLVYLYPTHLR